MAKKSYMTSDALIASVKRRALVPGSQATFENADFLAFADEEMSIGLVPSVIQMQEDYLMYSEAIPLVSGTSRYTIPYRSIGSKLREVSFQDQNGNVFQMTRIGVGDLPEYNVSSGSRANAFYVENNDIVLVPANNTFAADTSLLMTYYMRPNTLVMLDAVAVVTSVNRTTGVVQLENMPEDFDISELFDIIKVRSTNKTLDYDITATALNVTAKTITFALADIPASLEAGDHIALAEECAIPQVPSDLHVVLAHRVAARVLEALGDLEGLATANQKLGEMEAKTQIVIDNRVKDAPRKIVNRNGFFRGRR
jgi:hypothetical protein